MADSGFIGVSMEMAGRGFHTKVVGVTKPNPDGSNRQKIIQEFVRVGAPLIFTHEPENPYDKNAIRVEVERRTMLGRREQFQIGYLSRDVAESVHQIWNRGEMAIAEASDVTGGTRDRPTRGVNVRITIQ